MLREIKNVQQERGSGSRRWFESDGFDLVVWLDRDDAVTGFQICYDLGRGEHALTWRAEQGFTHSAIDAGDDTPLKNQTPVLVPDGVVPWTLLQRTFDARATSLDTALRHLVSSVLNNAGK